MTWNALWVALAALTIGCTNNGTAPNGGSGGGSGGGGFATGGQDGAGGNGEGGIGGTSDTGGAGRGGGTGLSAGGAGGAGGEGGTAGGYRWLADPAIWSEVDLETPPSAFKILVGDPSVDEFTPIGWSEDCGHGCSSSSMSLGDFTGSAILGSASSAEQERTDVIVVVSHHFMEDLRLVRRMVSLSSGKTVNALQFVPNDPEDRGFVIGPRTEDAKIFLVLTEEGRLWVTLGQQSSWDFKSPWHHESHFAKWCHSFSLAAEPPVAFFGCGNGLHVMKGKGSSEVTVFPNSKASAVGTGDHGVAVWAQHEFEEGRGLFSRIRSWSPGEEITTIKELSGDVCGLAVGPNHLAGFKGDSDSELCGWVVSSPRFFWISRDDGEVTLGPTLPNDELSVGSFATTEDFTAAKFLRPPDVGIPHEERTRVTLIRHSDGKMRQFSMPPAGYSMGETTVALDDEYLYFTRWNSAPGDHSFDRIFRYQLDLFDEIGIPYPPEGG